MNLTQHCMAFVCHQWAANDPGRSNVVSLSDYKRRKWMRRYTRPYTGPEAA